MNYKIVQIIPAPNNMYSVYYDPEEEVRSRVVCLALIEYADGSQEVVPMDITEGDGIIDKIGTDLKCIEFIC